MPRKPSKTDNPEQSTGCIETAEVEALERTSKRGTPEPTKLEWPADVVVRI